mmetsp:Transcript_28978/g.94410  ORF Transcript_28978/g.94410 Transcript_28978/m.94410 type:complete len:471 (+) Transcript_28978:2558-3970(+)
MRGHHPPDNVRGAVCWRGPMPTHDAIVEALRGLAIFFPPAADGGGVMARGGAHAEVGVLVTATELAISFVRHPLHLERADPELAHDRRHAGRDHAQILPAHQHARRALQRRQLLQRLRRPQVFLPAVEVVHVQLVQSALDAVVAQLQEAARLVHRDARVEGVAVALVAQQHHIRRQLAQPPPQPVLAQPREHGVVAVAARPVVADVVLDRPLRGHVRLEAVRAAADLVQEQLRHAPPGIAEALVQQPPPDVGLREPVEVPHAPRPQLVPPQRVRGLEAAQQARNPRHGDGPDAEEAEDVVDAVGLEVKRHVLQTSPPPAEAVSAHGVPVVGGEAPVLANGAEGVGGRTRRAVQLEQVRLEPRLHPVGRHADGQVALDHHAQLVRALRGATQLQVQVPLLPQVEAALLPQRPLRQLAHAGLRHALVLAPLPEAHVPELVPQRAVQRVRPQPVRLRLHERLRLGRLQLRLAH